MMIDAFNHWLSVPTEQLNIVKRIVGLLHTASLLSVFALILHLLLLQHMLTIDFSYRMDDVEDGSELRRGIPGAYLPPLPLLNTC
jgi:geranylgeranyl diphosphate synthase type 3